MAWTVPSGCYYAVYTSASQWVYYNAGASVPTENAPNKGGGTNGNTYVLLDFSNGYIYNGATMSTMTLNITANNTFTVTSISPFKIKGTCYVYATQPTNLTLTGTQFTFGNGSGLLNKTAFMHSEYPYNMNLTFSGRTDITSVTIPSGVYSMNSCFKDCTSLTTVSEIPSGVTAMNSCFRGCISLTTSPAIPSSVIDMESCFRGCISLTTSPTIPSGVTNMVSCFSECVALTTPPTIPNGVTDMSYCFRGCRALTTPPAIPSSVTDMSHCFNYCTSLTTAPVIPSSVTNMSYCFYYCTSLTTASTIPSNVTDMSSCFRGCATLVGAITINSNTSSVANIFYGTVNEIVLLGTGGSNASIASQYANVYVWSLSSLITAQRDESVLTSVDISVDVTRFNTGTLTSLSLYENGGQTPLSVTWNDPTLTITSNPTTFTTTITGIAEGDTPTISVIATDQYGSSTAMSVNVPIAFYTMDVQAGGKEIAFGAIADDDLTNYPPTFDTSDKGLFKCNMTMVNTQMVGEIKMWAGNTAPNGWLVCDGSAISRTDYPLLFDAIGTLWGAGDGSTTFNLPNLKGRVPVGHDSADASFDTIGETGGSKYIQAHTHAHTNPSVTGGAHTHQYGYLTQQRGSGSSNTRVGPYGWQSSGVTTIGSSSEAHTHTVSGGSVGAVSGATTGSSGNLQPYAVVKYIICAI